MLSLKDIENNIHNNNEAAARTPSPNMVKEKDKTTITIIDNSSGISLQPTINIETDNTISSAICSKSKATESKLETTDVDKLSTTSKASAKTSSESINNVGTTSPNEERQVHSSQTNYHPRNRSGISSRKIGPPLVRSQTARNLSSHLSNQTVGAGNQQNANLKRESKKEIDKDREQGKE